MLLGPSGESRVFASLCEIEHDPFCFTLSVNSDAIEPQCSKIERYHVLSRCSISRHQSATNVLADVSRTAVNSVSYCA